jgi:pimeloyl-ACP methyl ester carboxylesterase
VDAVSGDGDVMAVTPPGPPPLRQFLIETPRAALALTRLPFEWRGALAGAPRGNGGPVLLLPGLFNSDRSMTIMAQYLRRLGHVPQGWELGRNYGQRSIGVDGAALLARIEALAQTSGRPVALVGVSMGGIMARFAAHRVPPAVEQVVTVASPYAGPARSTRVWRLYEWISGESVDDPAVLALAEEVRRPLPVPATAIWSASDGLVNGRCCHVPGEPGCRAVEVVSSHYGVQTRPRILRAVAEALVANGG